MPQVTFRAVVLTHRKRADGTYSVKVRITYKGVSRILPTNLVCRQSDLTRKLKIKNATILNKTDILIHDMREAIADISPFDMESHDVDWVIGRIRDKLTEETFQLDFFEWSDKYILTKTVPTRTAYLSAINTLERFLGKRTLDINAITRDMLLEFMEFVDNEPRMHYNTKTKMVEPLKVEKIAKGASTRHLCKLQHLFMAAKDRYNDEDAGRILIPRDPFKKIQKTYPIPQGQANLGRELMQRIISCQVDSSTMRTALDLFILSFAMMGANMADLYYAQPFSGDTWIYNRQKTKDRRADHAEMRVRIPECIRPVIARLRGEGGWWLNELHTFASSKEFATKRVNRLLAKWAKDNEVDVFTFYAARHTWASLGRTECGIDKSTIDDCLVHKGSFDMADIYAEKAWNVMQQANAKVLDLFEW